MDDIIGQGEGRAAWGWRRRLVLIAALAVVAAIVVAEHLPRGDAHRLHPSASIRLYGGAAPIIGLQVPARQQGPSGILGPTSPVEAGIRLPRTGAQPDWFWPAQGGSSRPIGGLPFNHFGYVFTRVGGGWAIQPNPVGPAGCGNCPGPPVPVYYLGDHVQTAIMTGSATFVAPAATAAAMWLTSFPPGSDLGTATGIAREYSGTGVPRGPAIRLPAGMAIVQATDRGLLLTSMAAGGRQPVDKLWDPVTAKTVRTFTGVIAASPGEVALIPSCAVSCSADVVNLATGRATGFSLRPGSSVTSGYFSPDGRFLALAVSFGDGGDGGALAMQLEVATIATGRLLAVPRTWVSSDALDGFGWPGNGDTLVAELTFSTRVQLAVWDTARASLAVTDVSQDQDPAALAVGP
jgi:hypothetical protein